MQNPSMLPAGIIFCGMPMPMASLPRQYCPPRPNYEGLITRTSPGAKGCTAYGRHISRRSPKYSSHPRPCVRIRRERCDGPVHEVLTRIAIRERIFNF